jgi:4-hydroxybenzoyl-CoA thioesterase
MITHDRRVHFEDVDAAGIVFFARLFGYCHDAMERFFDDIEGGYVALVNVRKVGFPVVHVTSDFRAPIAYGDVARITGSVRKLGTTSTHLAFTMTRARDGVEVASFSHVAVCTDLHHMTKMPLPPDVRVALEKHLGG